MSSPSSLVAGQTYLHILFSLLLLFLLDNYTSIHINLQCHVLSKLIGCWANIPAYFIFVIVIVLTRQLYIHPYQFTMSCPLQAHWLLGKHTCIFYFCYCYCSYSTIIHPSISIYNVMSSPSSLVAGQTY